MYTLYYNGLFERMKIIEVEKKEVAMDICEKHNKTLSNEMLRAGIGNMFFR